MHLSVSANFQNDFIESIKKYPVEEVYGKIPADFIGGGRPSIMVPSISKKGIQNFIKNLHLNSIEFNYLLNSTCLNNQELTNKGYKNIRRCLDWLSKIETDTITVAMPYLCEIIKLQYPHFKIKVSAFAGITNLSQVKYWEELGADMVTLEPQTMNREFGIIQHITRNTNVNIQLIVNQGCLYSCPNVKHHSNLMSHASQKNHYLKGFYIDYYAMKCKFLKLNEKVNFIRNSWIRPEDVHEYESIGVKHFKIIQRNWPTEKLEKIIRAYIERKYEGNLADLEEFLFGQNIFLSKWRQFKYFFRPFSINLYKLWKLYKNIKSIESYIEIDNKALAGFIEIFKKESCQLKNCAECRYCYDIAQKVVKIKNREDLEKLKQNLEWFIARK